MEDSLALSEKCVALLVEADRQILTPLGITVHSIDHGQVALAMKVNANMVNSQKICHGGLVFSLADSASAYATASLNIAPLTTEASISLLHPAKLGDMLLASASIEHRGKSVLHVCVRVTNQDQVLVAIYRGCNLNRGACINV